MKNYPIKRLLLLLLSSMGLPLLSAAQQVQPQTTASVDTSGRDDNAAVAALNQHHQQTQLQIQQQRLDNELMRLRLAYADMKAELRQLDSTPANTTATTASQPEAGTSLQIISQVNFSHMRLQWLGGEQPQWRLQKTNKDSPND